jgi:hypothetical protein
LRKAGYTGEIYIIIDNEDETAQQYYDKFGDKVIMYDKAAIAETFDEGDNFQDRRSVFYPRNASFGIARQLGMTYFMQLDDDYNRFEYRINDRLDYPPKHWIVKSGLDSIFDLLLDFYKSISAVSIAVAQGGDFIGGSKGSSVFRMKRKCMNSFICSTERPFQFVGKMNEDVNTYVWYQGLGNLFLSIPFVSIGQTETQSNPGGMSELYLDVGTYVKSFYPIMYSPSCVKIGVITGESHQRIHHSIEWEKAVPCIIEEKYCKVQGRKALEVPGQ